MSHSLASLMTKIVILPVLYRTETTDFQVPSHMAPRVQSKPPVIGPRVLDTLGTGA
jgi:hypothetical protein